VRKLFTTKRRIAIAGATTVLALAGGGAAFAYFTSSGSGTGTATVGTASTFTVAEASASGTILPGAGSSVILYTVTNTGTGDESYATDSVALPTETNGDAEHGGVDIPGCLATWFTPVVTTDPGLNTSIAGGGHVTVTVTVTMPDLSTTDQTACAGKAPDVTLTVGAV